MRSDKVLPIFMHIPRTGGTSVQRYAEQLFGKEHILEVYGQDIEHPKALAGRTDASQLQLVRGHFGFGIHEAIQRPTRYFTVVRHPVDRVVSLYKYICAARPHPYHDVVSQMSVVEFARSGASTETDNGQCRQISGAGEFPQTPYVAGTPPFGECTEELFTKAISNILSKFDIVLIFPQVDMLPRLLSLCYGWKELELPKANASKRQPRAQQPTEEDRKAIEKINELDMRLYHFCSTIRGGVL